MPKVCGIPIDAMKLAEPSTNAPTLAPSPPAVVQEAYRASQASVPSNVPPSLGMPRASPATQARITRVARKPSVSMLPNPTNLASFSHFICLLEVPLATRQWNPLHAPQAIVINKKGKISGASAGSISIIGAAIVSSGLTPSTGAPPMNAAAMSPTTMSKSTENN